MDHILKNCQLVDESIKNLLQDDYSFSITLKVELNLIGKVSQKLGFIGMNFLEQYSYLGVDNDVPSSSWI